MHEPLNVVLTPIGSAGDVHPFLAVGRALAARGHAVTVITAETFAAAAERAGLDIVAFPLTAPMEAALDDPDLWHPTRGFRTIMRLVTEDLDARYAEIAARDVPGRTVLVGHCISFAARVYEEVNGTPAATVQLAPSVFRSVHAQPVHTAGTDLSGWPRLAKRALWWAVDRFVLDPHLVPRLAAFRARFGLAPLRRPFAGWIHSPNRVIGMFPEWFGPVQPDWPARLALVGFPLDDGPDDRALDAALDAWIAAGDPPVAFTAGSANRQAPRFFATAAAASARLGRRALLLTPHREQVPAALPDGVRQVDWAPFRALLPRCAALVHHGGIGTCAQGLAAGIPHLVMPMGFDQPDNAARLERLGVGRWLVPAEFTEEAVAEALGSLLASDAVAAACRRWRGAIPGDAVERAADLVEEASETGTFKIAK